VGSKEPEFTTGSHTRAEVEFHSDQHADGEPIILSATENFFGRLVSLQTSKGFDGLSGSWSCVIKKPPGTKAFGGVRYAGRQNSLLRVWRDPEDVWVRIYIVKNGKKVHLMTGLVDSIRESMHRTGEGTRVEAYTIAGRDCGKVLETTEVWVNQYDFGGNAVAGLAKFMTAFADHPGLSSASPSKWVRTLVESFVGNNGIAETQWTLPASLGGGSFFDLLSMDNLQDMDDGNGKFSDLGLFAKYDTNHGIGNLAEVLESYSNDFLNELWLDMTDTGEKVERPALHLRERPFVTFESGRERWESIRSHTLEKRDVAIREMAKGGTANRYNYWSIRVDGNVTTMDERSLNALGKLDNAKQGEPGGIPIWNRDSIAMHGVRKWQKGTLFLNGFIEGHDEKKLWPSMAANWLRKAHDWYCIAPWQISGTITTSQVKPSIRLGNRLIESRDEGEVEYYVEGVAHEWRYPGAARTTLTLTRGQYIGDDLIGAYRAEMDNGSILPDCVPGEHGANLTSDNVIDSILMQCKFTPQASRPDGGLKVVNVAGIDATFALADGTDLEALGKTPGAFGGGTPKTNPDRKIIPDADVESKQASDIAKGDPKARLRRKKRLPFDKVALGRGEIPGEGESSEENDPFGNVNWESNDPLEGL